MNSYTWRAGILKSDLAATTRLVLLTLSCHINDAGESAFPSTKLLAKESGLSERAVISHLAIAKEKGWLTVKRHGFGGQGWARHEYYPRFPEDSSDQRTEPPSVRSREGAEPPSARQTKRTEPRSARCDEGTEPHDEKALNEVQCNYPYELPTTTTAVGGGSGEDSRARQAPPPESEEEIEREVNRIKTLHFQVCGLNTLPPLAIVREILRSGKPPSLIDDVYQAHGGDVPKYRQRNIVERLTALRDGQERASPSGPRRARDGLSASERRQQATFEAARAFAGGFDDDGSG